MQALRTERLNLLPARVEDVDALHELWIEPGVRRHLWDGVEIGREQAEEVVHALAELAATRGFGLWKVCEQAADELIGFCALRGIGETDEIEILYGLTESAWGRGLASEAARAVLRYGFEVVGLERIWARTDPPNVDSQRVIAGLGMQPADDPGAAGTLAFVLERRQFFDRLAAAE